MVAGVCVLFDKASAGQMKQPCVYLLASKPYGTLYVGVTSDLARRVSAHKQGLVPGFTKRHDVKCLVYYDIHRTMDEAIRREKQLKERNRAWKVRLIENMNPEWIDLYDEASGAILQGPADTARESR